MKVDIKTLIGTLDTVVKNDIEQTAQRCLSRGGSEILIEDKLFVMLERENSLLLALLAHYDISTETMVQALQKGLKTQSSESSNPIFSKFFIQWLEDAYFIARLDLNMDELNETALLLALFEKRERYMATSYFKPFSSIDAGDVIAQLKGLNEEAIKGAEHTNKPVTSGGEVELEKYTSDITQLAREGKIDPVLSRESEIKQAVDILLRRRKNNPIMVGEAGVGKTAIVEGLALKIVEEDVPTHLQGARLLSLDLGAMQAGASIKGEFERRLQGVIKEIQSSPVFTILFIDEAHTLVGAGGNEGGSDAANILKPALARGELKTIAATTWLEYRKYFEKDPALSRRFQKVDLLEPTVDEAVTILRGLAGKYEEVHGVYIEDAALVAAASLSARYITGRQLPDKAIDVLDTACANVKISKSNRPFALQRLESDRQTLERTIVSLQRDEERGLQCYDKQITEQSRQLKDVERKIKKVSTEWERQKKLVEKLVELRKEGKDKAVEREYEKLQKRYASGHYIYEHVSADQVAEVIASWTGIPLGSMRQDQSANMLSLREKLKSTIIGQDEAIEHLNTFLEISVAGMKNENAPEGVFLLVGPSGVGKTETARSVAKNMYGGERFLTTINMTEFQEKHTLSRLIGSPPGYVGYGDGGQLTDPVRVKPYSVVLLDEIEKAHPDILNLFYQIFDRGVVSDGEGREIDFRNTVIFMTSNLATQEITSLCAQDDSITMEAITEAITPTLSAYLKPALLGRMKIIPYKNLSADSLAQIIRLRLDGVEKRLASKGIAFKYQANVVDYLVSRSNTQDTGARNIDLIINTELLPNISREILEYSLHKKELTSIAVYFDEEKKIYMRSI